jgi:hypothetical protein
LSPLENNVLTTVASGAGYMTGGGEHGRTRRIVHGHDRATRDGAADLWFAVIAALGVFVAIPIKRQLINQEELAFPTETATAETIRTIHAQGGGDGAVNREPSSSRPASRP